MFVFSLFYILAEVKYSDAFLIESDRIVISLDQFLLDKKFSKIGATSTVHIALLEALDVKVTALSLPKNLYNQKDYDIYDLGYPVDLERLIKSGVDLLITSSIYDLNFDVNLLDRFDIRMLEMHEYQEQDPLARSEWIKVLGAILDKKKEANDFFRKIEDRYQMIKNKVNKNFSIITGYLAGDIWIYTDENSYLATIIKDAGGKYLMDKSVTKTLEGVLPFFPHDNIIWATHNFWKTRSEMILEDSRYNYKKGRIVNNINRMNSFGGNDFWENGILRPDEILLDFIKIADGKDQMYWYKDL